MTEKKDAQHREEIENNEPTEATERGNRVAREILSYVRLIAIVVAIVFLMQSFVIINAKIPSESMEMTIMTGDHIFGNRLAYKFKDPERYDIVIFRYPDNESQLFIKRIIGLPGEVVEIRDGAVYINGSEQPLTDSFCFFDENDTMPGTNPGRGTPETENGTRFVVPEDCYFMLGDNRDHSKDSRYWNNPYVERKKILGKAFLRYWPLSRISVIRHDQGYAHGAATEGEG